MLSKVNTCTHILIEQRAAKAFGIQKESESHADQFVVVLQGKYKKL